MVRRVLSLLLSRAEHVVPMEQLIEELWGDRAPRLARKTAQTHVYNLRAALRRDTDPDGRDLLETHANGYRIRVEPGQLDLWQFKEGYSRGKAALRRGDVSTASSLLHRALDLWTGDAFTGVEPGPMLSAQRASIEDLRLQALEERIDADLRLGRHRALVGELKALTIRYPLHEEFCAQFMLAAHRSGMDREALAAYRGARRSMIAELGLEPSPRLRELQQRVLSGDSTLWDLRPDPPASGPAWSPSPYQLPPELDHLVDREHALAAIDEAARATTGAKDPGLRVVVITGGVGTGKTVTAVRAGHRLQAHFPDGQLFAVLHRPDGTPSEPAEILRSFLATVGLPPDETPERLDDLTRLFRGWAVHRRLLLLLDDAASTEQILPLLPAGANCTVLVTSRHRLGGFLGATTTIPLGPVGMAGGVALLAAVAGPLRVDKELHAAEEIVRLCDGLPIAIRAAAEKLVAWPARSLREFAGRLSDERRRLTELSSAHLDVGRLLRDSRARLGERERQALDMLCRDCAPVRGLPALESGLGIGRTQAEHLVESLASCHLLETAAGPAGDLRFSVPRMLRLAFADRDGSPRPEGDQGRPPAPSSANAPVLRARRPAACGSRARAS
ncbi:transcriptional regulator [Streptomyces cocklensis]|jgi:DNA-binding SARP family transcriptional activator|nr:BTAD domain-containing putative transcriptional regulator [Actinacidiphila cocklensis]MDD1060777.1 transcriptional regulator [Actinacidiphila cocklensis]WSX73703.1 transcriptional regulator [Streptomyces sp. NBC_00899]WSX80234.1 transcriptional regulator [Streptomyces sp. NBC_00899]